MKRGSTLTVILILLLSTIPSVSQAKGIAGAKCAKAGATTSSSGTKYRCTKADKGLNWVKIGISAKRIGASSSTASKTKQVISVLQTKSVDITAGRIGGVFSASSQLSVEVQSSTSPICTVQGASILLLQTGKCSLVANQSGNSKFLPAQQVSFTFDIAPPKITSDNALFDEVQTFIRVPKGSTYSSDTAEISLTTFSNDATAKVCANDASALGCTSVNGSGVADPTSQTRYVEFDLHVKNLDANPLPTVSYQLLTNGVLSDIDTGVSLETLNNLTVEQNESADSAFYGLVQKDMNLGGAYLVINEGITDPSTRLLLALDS